MITASIDISGMETVLRGLSVATMKPMKDVTTAEVVSILQTCLDRTKLTPAEKLRQATVTKFNQYSGDGRWGTHSQGSFPKISICSKNGNVWLGLARPSIGAYSRTRGRRGGGVWHLVNKHYERNEDWNTYQQLTRDRVHHMKNRIDELLKRRGLPKTAWAILAANLGFTLKAASVVINSTIGKKPLSELGHAEIEQTSTSFTIHASNQSIASLKKDAAGILQRTINGRIKYFERNLEKGVFDSMKHVEHAYPNLVKLRAA